MRQGSGKVAGAPAAAGVGDERGGGGGGGGEGGGAGGAGGEGENVQAMGATARAGWSKEALEAFESRLKVLSLVTLYTKYTRGLTFQKLVPGLIIIYLYQDSVSSAISNPPPAPAHVTAPSLLSSSRHKFS